MRPARHRHRPRVNGPRGAVLLCAGVFCAAHVVSCLPVGGDDLVLPIGLDRLDDAVPLPVYAALWGCALALCALGAVRRPDGSPRERVDTAAFALTAGMTLAWSGTFLLGWVVDRSDPTRQWVLATAYAAVAALVATSARLVNPADGTPAP